MKKTICLMLAAVMVFSLCACGKSDLAKHADETIAAIGNVTDKSLSQIERAEAEVNALSDKEKKSLDNLTTLYDARSAYNELAAGKVEALINSIGELNFSSGTIIMEARNAYNNESTEVQSLVGNYDLLEKAEESLPTVRAGIVSDEVKKILDASVTTAEDVSSLDAAIEKLNMMYEDLNPEEKDAVTDYEKIAEKKTESEKVLAQSVLQDVRMWTEQIYSHLELYINFKNPNEKTIKYIRWGVMFQNPVGDYMEKNGDIVFGCSDTGPYETGKGRTGSGSYWQFFSSKIDIYEVEAVRLGSVEIEYMDGSKILIENPEALDSVMKK